METLKPLRSGYPFDSGSAQELLETEPTLNTNIKAERLNLSHKIVVDTWKNLAKISKLMKWVPHTLLMADL